VTLLCALIASEAVGAPDATSHPACARGQAAAVQRQTALAVLEFERCVSETQGHPNALLQLALAQRDAGAPLLAIAWLEAYLEQSGADAQRAAARAEANRLIAQVRKKTSELLRLADEAARSVPEEIWGERQQALETTAFLQALAGHIQGAVQSSADAGSAISPAHHLRVHAELLAAAHDYDTVRAVLEQIDDPAEGDRLRVTLARLQLLRGEYADAVMTLRSIANPSARQGLLKQLVAARARSLDVREAQELLADALDAAERFELKQILLLGYLRANRIEAALTLARAMRKEPVGSLAAARSALGEGGQVFAELDAIAIKAERAPDVIVDAYLATLAALWRGDVELARRGCDRIDAWIDQHSLDSHAVYATIARAYLDAEMGRIDATFAALAALDSRTRSEFAVSLFWRLAQQGRLDEMQRLILALDGEPATQGRLLAELPPLLGAAERHVDSILTAQLAAEHARRHRLGFVLRDLAEWAEAYAQLDFAAELRRQERVAHWAALASSLGAREPVSNLEGFLAWAPGKDLRAVTADLQQASADWIGSLAYLRAVSERHASR
jgi:hypothetical protein